MANKKNYWIPKKPSLTLIQQKIALVTSYKEAECAIDKNKGDLTWFGRIRPTPISREYQVLITYEIGYTPRVWVIGDELENLDSSDFPHKFEIDSEKKMVRICLCRYWEFNSRTYLANTIVPWTVEWLYFYEMWLATGEWHGGGDHPAIGEKKEDNKATN